ncbi:unnamed protein product [Urochloa decumbens]|uniref:Uncharacterized protein n=1 Tax=Urochloa decumbens TaxID=240449 RepID=A0ABC8VYW0_9POAL
MASTSVAFKGALVVAACIMLLHSSMGQQPDSGQNPTSAPVFSCGDSCNSNCTPRCEAKFEAEHGKCNTTAELYDDCFKGCTSQCKGNYHARGSCTMDSCSASSCGNPCARSCCESCSTTAPDLFIRCMSSRGMVMISCMPPCMDECINNCNNGSAPPMP